MAKYTFKLSGLTCTACKKISEKRIGSIPGVSRVEVDINSGEAMVSSSQPISYLEIDSALEGTQYQVTK